MLRSAAGPLITSTKALSSDSEAADQTYLASLFGARMLVLLAMAYSLRPLIQAVDDASENLCHTVSSDVDDAERSRLLTAVSRLQNVLEPVAMKLQKLTLGVSLQGWPHLTSYYTAAAATI